MDERERDWRGEDKRRRMTRMDEGKRGKWSR